jgi:hypothetical protein
MSRFGLIVICSLVALSDVSAYIVHFRTADGQPVQGKLSYWPDPGSYPSNSFIVTGTNLSGLDRQSGKVQWQRNVSGATVSTVSGMSLTGHIVLIVDGGAAIPYSGDPSGGGVPTGDPIPTDEDLGSYYFCFEMPQEWAGLEVQFRANTRDGDNQLVAGGGVIGQGGNFTFCGEGIGNGVTVYVGGVALSDLPASMFQNGEQSYVEGSAIINEYSDVPGYSPVPESTWEARTEGESFEDTNGNGVRDPGEPYSDANGNGRHDPGQTVGAGNVFGGSGTTPLLLSPGASANVYVTTKSRYDAATGTWGAPVTFVAGTVTGGTTSSLPGGRFGASMGAFSPSGSQSAYGRFEYRSETDGRVIMSGTVGPSGLAFSGTPNLASGERAQLWISEPVFSMEAGNYSTPSGSYDVEPFEDGNGNGIRDQGESFSDLNGNGVYDSAEIVTVSEPFTDTNGNGVKDLDEPFVDSNENGSFDVYIVTSSTFRASGQYITGGQSWSGSESPLAGNYNSSYISASYTDPEVSYIQITNAPVEGINPISISTNVSSLTISNYVDSGVTSTVTERTAEPGEDFEDANGNGIYDGPDIYVDVNENGVYDEGDEYTDVNGNGVYDAGETFTDSNGNGQYDAPVDGSFVDGDFELEDFGEDTALGQVGSLVDRVGEALENLKTGNANLQEALEQFGDIAPDQVGRTCTLKLGDFSLSLSGFGGVREGLKYVIFLLSAFGMLRQISRLWS